MLVGTKPPTRLEGGGRVATLVGLRVSFSRIRVGLGSSVGCVLSGSYTADITIREGAGRGRGFTSTDRGGERGAAGRTRIGGCGSGISTADVTTGESTG